MTLVGEKGSLDSDVTVEDLEWEIISNSMKQYRTFTPSNRNKRVIIDSGAKIFDMLVKYKSSQKTLIQVTQRQVASKNEEVVAAFVNGLPRELRKQVLAYGRKQNQLELAAPTD